MIIFDGILILIVTNFLIISGHAFLLNLYKGSVCQKGEVNSSNYVCKLPENCPSLTLDIKSGRYPPICSFIGNKPVVCCSPGGYNNNSNSGANNYNDNETNRPAAPITFTDKTAASSSYTAAEMCRQYSELVYANEQNPDIDSGSTTTSSFDCQNNLMRIKGGSAAKPKEFPHMALLGYGGSANEEKTWGCGGSLISNRWILSAAHCRNNSGKTVSWALLGDVNLYLVFNDVERKTYEIVERVVHPNYNPAYVYYDIGLFRLRTDVIFSAFLQPICLNTDQLLYYKTASAAGWGWIRSGGPTSPKLLKVDLSLIPIDQCKNSYRQSLNQKIKFGIFEDQMICAGDFKDGNDTCTGDSGGPLQVQNPNYSCMYNLIGITSFGKYCGSKDTPGVYTRVSYYINWIERIVWPRS